LISHRAAAFAVLVALLAGVMVSLAIRPPGAARVSLATGSEAVMPSRIDWRVPLAFPTNMPILGEPQAWVSEFVNQVSAGAVRLNLFEPGELVPPFSVTDAVRDGKVPAGMAYLGYDQGKLPASVLLAAVPFGFEPWEYLAWWNGGGGRELAEELYASYNIHPILCGLIGPETAGWFREPLESLEDIRGLKIRFSGLGGKVLERAGASVTVIPSGEIFQALEKGAIDATEFSLPVVDQSLGFARIAKLNYFPGWHQTSTASHMVVNLDTWASVSPADRILLEGACSAAVIRSLSASEAQQGDVLAGFPALGVKADRLPDSILRELQSITLQVLDAEAANDADFARILESQREFSRNYAPWKRLAYLPRDF
jgi:TRAP-type mannitol/chloroaromatic compound transport system substrate-binding protein